MSFLSMLSMFKSRAVIYIVGVILLAFFIIAWHKTVVKRAVGAENARLTVSFENAKNEAINAAIEQADFAIKSSKIESDKQNEKIKQDATNIIDRHNAGTGRLSIPANCKRAVTGIIGSDTNSPAGETRAELSSESVEFFVREAKRADEVVIELNELLSIIEQMKGKK